MVTSAWQICQVALPALQTRSWAHWEEDKSKAVTATLLTKEDYRIAWLCLPQVPLSGVTHGLRTGSDAPTHGEG